MLLHRRAVNSHFRDFQKGPHATKIDRQMSEDQLGNIQGPGERWQPPKIGGGSEVQGIGLWGYLENRIATDWSTFSKRKCIF